MVDKDLELLVTKHLRFLGVPSNHKGFNYLRYAILLVMKDATYKDALTKRLYPDVAIKFDTSWSRVERAIRYAIESAFNRNDTTVMGNYFGRNVTWISGNATNSEFVSTVADNIALGLEVD